MSKKARKVIPAVMATLLASLMIFCQGSGGGGGGDDGGGWVVLGIISPTVQLARVKMAADFPDGSNLATGYANVTFLQTLAGRRVINIAVDLNGDGAIAAYAVGPDTQEEWIVQNMPALVDVAEPNRYNFAFYDEAADAKVNLAGTAVLTDAPIDGDWDGTAPAVKLAAVNFTVLAVGQDTLTYTMTPGSETGLSLAGSVAAVSYPPPTEGTPLTVAAVGDFSAFNSGTPDIRQGHNECVPTSAANGLRWLAQKNGYNDKLPDSDRDMIEELKRDLNWDRDTGVVSGTNFIPGKTKFCNDNQLPIETHLIGSARDRGLAAKVKEEMDKGQAVELTMSFYKKNASGAWERKGGHMVSAVGAFKNSGGTYLDFHDPDTDTLLDTYKLSDTQFTDSLTMPNYLPPLTTIIELAFAQSPAEITPTECSALADIFIAMQTTDVTGDESHLPFTGDPIDNNTLHFTIDGNVINITGALPFVAVSGSVGDNCGFSATGMGTVAGYPNVSVSMEGGVSSSGVTGTYAMGAHGELPGGGSIVFHYQGDL